MDTATRLFVSGIFATLMSCIYVARPISCDFFTSKENALTSTSSQQEAWIMWNDVLPKIVLQKYRQTWRSIIATHICQLYQCMRIYFTRFIHNKDDNTFHSILLLCFSRVSLRTAKGSIVSHSSTIVVGCWGTCLLKCGSVVFVIGVGLCRREGLQFVRHLGHHRDLKPPSLAISSGPIAFEPLFSSFYECQEYFYMIVIMKCAWRDMKFKYV